MDHKVHQLVFVHLLCVEVGDQKTDVIPLEKEDSKEEKEKKQENISILEALSRPCPLYSLSHMLPAGCDVLSSYTPGEVSMLGPRN